MGQKINPNILHCGLINKWDSEYTEKKSLEFSKYTFQDLNLKQFLIKMLNENGLIVNNLKLTYNYNSLDIFIAYYLNYNLILPKNTKNKKKIPNLTKIASFLRNIFTNLKLFKTKKVTILITFEQLNSIIRRPLIRNNIKHLKKIVLGLRKYQKSSFFKEGINSLYIILNQKNPASLLAKFIAIQLEKNKKHNFFLRFLQTYLKRLTKRKLSYLKGIKIKIKGKINGRPRARHKIIKIKDGVSLLTFSSKIKYSEQTSFTSKGTIGIKVWTEKL